MKRYPAKKGPFSMRLWFDEGEIDKLCVAELRRLDLLPESPSPVAIDAFFPRRHQIDETYVTLKPGRLGALKFNANGVESLYVSRELGEDESPVSQRRVRSTIAHEGGHALFHTELYVERIVRLTSHRDMFGEEEEETADVGRDTFTCGGETGPAPRADEWWEFQANQAMAALLLPSHLVRTAMEQLAPNFAGLDVAAQQAAMRRVDRELAEVFDVNPIMVAYRTRDWWAESAQQPTLF